LKRNLKFRYETFLNECEKMKSRWKQLRPKEQDMEDEKKCRDSLKIVREREKEVQDMIKQKDKML
jgi:alpha-glucuronidase